MAAFERMKRILCTGGSGFLGHHVVKLLQAKISNTVIPLDNLEPHCGGRKDWVHAEVDVTNRKALDAEIESLEATDIIHLAALGRNLTCRDFPQRAYEVNVNGTHNVLESAKRHGVKRVIVCSSNIVLSDQDTIYKTTKIGTEKAVKHFAGQGLSVMGLRPSNIYGAGQSRTEYQPCAFAALDECYRLNGYFEISGDGSQTRDWVNAEDVARAFQLALDSDFKGDTLDVCTGVQTSMNEIVLRLDVQANYTPARPGDAKALVSNPEPAAMILGFRTQEKLSERIWDAFPNVKTKGVAA